MSAVRVPYPGLRAFESTESDLFFGRDGCVDEMLDVLDRESFLAVLGTSGSGKSSLVRTGLIDSLELGFLPGSTSRWQIADLHPGGRPMRNLARALLASKGDREDLLEETLLQSFLERGPLSLTQWVEDGNLPHGTHLLLLVDQFEELFRYQDYAGREKAEAFVALLLEAARSDSRVHVVITMRSEYLGACALMPGLAEQINSSLYLTRRMTRDECRLAIEGPARVLGFEVEPQLVNRILNDLASFAPWETDGATDSLSELARRADQLPLMQHVLNRLWQKARAEAGEAAPVLRHDDYDRIGGLRGAVDAHGEDVIARLPNGSVVAFEAVFRSLVAGTGIRDAVRDPRTLAQLQATADPEMVRTVVDAFRSEGCNFLRPAAPAQLDDDTVVDLGHESLIRQWSLMERWLSKEVRSAGAWRRLVAAAEAKSDGTGDLLSGLDLANARNWWSSDRPSEAWTERYGGDYALVSQFVDESTVAESVREAAKTDAARRERQSLRQRAAAFLALAVLSIGAAIFAWRAGQDAVDQKVVTERALDASKASQAFTIRATDDFLIDQTNTLRNAIGVPREDVENLFEKAEGFLAELEDHVDEDAPLYRLKAGLALEKSDYANDRHDFALALQEASRAVEVLADGTRGEYRGDDIDLRFRALLSEANEHRNLGDYVAAGASLNQAEQFLAEHVEELDDEQRVSFESALSSARASRAWSQSTWSVALSHAKDCLARLDDLTEPTLKHKRRRIYCSRARLVAAQDATEGETQEYIAQLETALALIPPEERSRGDWIGWAYSLTTLAWRAMDAEDYDRALGMFESIATEMRRISGIEPEDREWNERLAWATSNIGVAKGRLGEHERALEVSLEAVELSAKFRDQFEAHPEWASDHESMLRRAETAIRGISGFVFDPQLVAKMAELTETRVKIIDLLVRTGEKTECEECQSPALTDAAIIHNQRHYLGDKAAFSDFLAAFDRVVNTAFGYLDYSDMSISAVQTRRNLGVLLEQIPQQANLFPSSLEHDEVLERVESLISRVEEIRTKIPEAALARLKYGALIALKAELLLEDGQSDAASKLTQQGDTLGSYGLISLELNRLRSQPSSEARGAEIARLENRIESVTPFPIVAQLSGDPRWTEEEDISVFRIPIWGSDTGQSATDEIIWWTRNIMCIELTQTSVEQIMELEDQARQNSTNLAVLKMSDLGDGMMGLVSPERSVEIFRREIENRDDPDDYSMPASILASGFLNPGMEHVTLKAIDLILGDKDHALHDDSVEAIAYLLRIFETDRDLKHSNGFSVGLDARSSDVLYEFLQERFHDLSSEHVALFYAHRGDSRYDSSDATQQASGLADLATALALASDDPRVMRITASVWAENPDLAVHAIPLLEEAMEKTSPDSLNYSYTLGALGWAYAQSGNLDKGRALLEQAIRLEKWRNPAYHQWLAIVLERLGRHEDALERIYEASSIGVYRREKTLAKMIKRRLEQHSDYAADDLDAAQKIAAKVAEVTFDRASFSLDEAGVAIQGFDPVSYHDSGPLRGKMQHHHVSDKGIWLFATEENKRRFVEDIDKYMPAYGGHASAIYTLAEDNRPHGGPIHYSIRNGKLLILQNEVQVKQIDEVPDASISNRIAAFNAADKTTVYPPAPLSPYSLLLLSLQDEAAE